MSHPRVFISYSWTSQEHGDWVIRLATELRQSGVDVVLDKWDLREGNDAQAFMEQMVTDPTIAKVIIVSDKRYAEKADARSGGVGTETQIITPSIYAKKDQTRFVAVVTERGPDGEALLPAFYRSRIYIDMSSEESYVASFDNLLRWIYDKPVHIKPSIGPTPSFLSDDQQSQLPSSAAFRRAMDALRNSRPNAKGIITDFFQSATGEVATFSLSEIQGEYDDALIDSIARFVPQRNQMIELFLAVAQYQNTKETQIAVHHFFESLLPHLGLTRQSPSSQVLQGEHLQFIIHELFLYCIACLLKHECFDAVAYLLHTGYYFPDLASQGEDPLQGYDVFRPHLESLETRNKRLSLRRLSLHADLLKQREIGSGLSFEGLAQADFILFIDSCFRELRETLSRRWWPITLLYKSNYRGSTFEVFARARSLRYFDNIKLLFQIGKKEDFLPLFEAWQTRKLILPHWEFQTINPEALMAFQKLASEP